MKKNLSDWVDVMFGTLSTAFVLTLLLWGGKIVFAACTNNTDCNSGNCVLSSGGCRNNYPSLGIYDTCQTVSKEAKCSTCSCQADAGNCACLQKP
jgi:hypothetical protein